MKRILVESNENDQLQDKHLQRSRKNNDNYIIITIAVVITKSYNNDDNYNNHHSNYNYINSSNSITKQ